MVRHRQRGRQTETDRQTGRRGLLTTVCLQCPVLHYREHRTMKTRKMTISTIEYCIVLYFNSHTDKYHVILIDYLSPEFRVLRTWANKFPCIQSIIF